MTSAVVNVGLLVLAAAALVARQLPIVNHAALYLVVAAPYLAVAAPLALVLSLWGHRWLLAAVATGLTVALIAVQAPWYLATTPDQNAVAIRVVAINMLYGRADKKAIVDMAEAHADILLVQEFPPDAAEGLAAAGIEKIFPFQALDTQKGAQGAGIYSRYPITSTERVDGYALAMVKARVRVEGLTRHPTIVSVHMAAPWPQAVAAWRHDLERLPSTLADFAATADGGAVLVGGDFNSTNDMREFRHLLTNGYADAARQAGAGPLLTYPANRRIPSFMGIDHVLTHTCTAVAAQTMTVPNSDHRALLTTVAIPRT